MWKAQTLNVSVMWELKNKRTGKLQWLNEVEYDLKGNPYDPIKRLKDLGLFGKYFITEIRSINTIKDPVRFELKTKDIKITKSKKSDKRRTEDSK